MPDNVIISKERGPDKKKRKMKPASLKNLRPPVQPGEVRNPTGINGREKRLYSDCYVLTGERETPEALRILMNAKIRLQLKALIRAESDMDEDSRKHIQKIAKTDLIAKGTIWALANAIRMHVSALLEGDVSAQIEVREAVEGRVEQRVVVIEKNDRLKQLLNAFEASRTDQDNEA